ncbi:ABC-2 type transport system ATP-binding protein [Pseudarthrobacter oxydans]|uniref:ABC-2 type transport system ATP-binding protein n=1 Tax=Pseudarthrobacter oxydans TaxID=1671 RepID=A0AAW8NAL7_PSEOX|nr:ABC transporter ATP-binding protein [Pseudarthrobacter oxydans]MDR6792777.1 ABC-2 type transport system ATP-binding protein [Pseudarthrobacter oxydans]MDR7163965.1 ABC-2 type transport system ATP-binding protein [Pseudarthrobacter oxydans]
MTGPAGVPGRRTYGLTIETQGLTKRFGQQVAVDSLDLAVPSGAVFGFLGPNGSGKTTTIRMLLGLAAASAGTVRLLGKEMPGSFQDVLPRVGALVEGPAFYPFLSGTANLHRLDAAGRHADPATRRERVGLALERVGLGHAAGKRVHAYSLGMKQRLGIANALLSPRELLVLDEPTNGLDPQGTREVRNLVRSLAADGTTVFVSSHLLAEVEQICTHAAVMSAGRLVAQGPLAELRRSGSSRLRLVTPDAGPASSVLAALGLSPETGAAQPDGDVLVAALATPGFQSEAGAGQPAAEDIVAELVKAGVRVRGFAVERESLEDRFVELTGEGFDVAQ